MPTRTTSLPTLTLARAVYGFVLAAAVAVSLVAGLLLATHSGRLVDDALDSAVRVRAQTASDSFARLLHSDWADLKFLAAAIPGTEGAQLRSLMDGVRADGGRVAWVGFADVDGIVRQASAGMLIGVDASQRPWFRNGLSGDYAGDVHEAVLLRDLLGREGGEPRFVDLAMPVRTGGGDVIGVAAMHIDFDWAATTLDEIAEKLGLDLFLLSADGTIVLATNDTTPTPAELTILNAARTGAATSGREVWPDGRSYFSSLVPRVGYGDLPNFGWRLVGRLDGEAFKPDLTSFRQAGLWALVGIVAILLLLTAAFILFFIRPVEDVADKADRIADGEDIYPPDHRRTRETALLSAAIARLQGRG